MSQYGGNNSYPYQGQGEAASYYGASSQAGNWDQQQQQQQQQCPPHYHQPPHHQHPHHGQHHQQQPLPPQQPFPPQYSQQGFQPGSPGEDGERGVMGAIGGGLAGGVGGHALGSKTGHNKLGTMLGIMGGALAGHKLQDGISDWKDKRDEEKQQFHDKPAHGPGLVPHSHEPTIHTKSCGSNVNYKGNFTGSSRDIRLDAGGDYMLHASCRRVDGSYQASSICLNKFLQNDQGTFRWMDKHVHHQQQQPPPVRYVTVQPGDTLRGIASQAGCSFDELAKRNGLQNPDMIYPGQVLQVPNNNNTCAGTGSGNFGEKMGNFGLSARNVKIHVGEGVTRLDAELLRSGEWSWTSIVLDERIGNDNGTLTFKS